MQKRFIDPSELTEEYVKASLEETVRIANEIPQSRFFAESFENFPRDENGYVILVHPTFALVASSDRSEQSHQDDL